MSGQREDRKMAEIVEIMIMSAICLRLPIMKTMYLVQESECSFGRQIAKVCDDWKMLPG